ncbi:hypothetical protein HPB52_016766 [Rhipicephalus sanguineus]|uniref:Uncharacterized protein n=1 Tax=Rhipicephalus sanguineus TaxID=34632 RepID=A0A9D4T421_RHISA|nr:hypothetical protein HPB52_016766 [Rhipicephalus sanguineus]
MTALFMHRINPDMLATCHFCAHEYKKFENMLWLCAVNGLTELKFQEAWNKAITSSKYELKLWAVRRARDVVESLTSSAILGGLQLASSGYDQ